MQLQLRGKIRTYVLAGLPIELTQMVRHVLQLSGQVDISSTSSDTLVCQDVSSCRLSCRHERFAYLIILHQSVRTWILARCMYTPAGSKDLNRNVILQPYWQNDRPRQLAWCTIGLQFTRLSCTHTHVFAKESHDVFCQSCKSCMYR
jgi:hypothetical protein